MYCAVYYFGMLQNLSERQKNMRISYKKLWKLLIDKDMTRTELRLKAGISSVSLAKLGKDEGVTTNVLLKVCTVLNCNIGDIMDIVPESEEHTR